MKMLVSMQRALALAALLLLAQPLVSSAQERWPAKPVRIVVPIAAGGSLDQFARLIGQKLGERLGQPFVIDNRPGGGTTLGAQAVADAPADGYTLLLSNVATNGTAPWLVKTAKYDPVADFTHVAMVMTGNIVLVASGKSNIRTLDDVVKLARERNGADIAISAVGGSSHLAGIRLASQVGIKFTEVPFRGSGPAQVSLLAGDVPLMIDSVPTMLPLAKSGGVRPIAVLAPKRDPEFPDMPTMAELGHDVTSLVWMGLSGPKNLPPAVTAVLNREVNAILKLPDIRRRYAELSATPPEASAAEFTAFVAKDTALWRDLIRANKISVD